MSKFIRLNALGLVLMLTLSHAGWLSKMVDKVVDKVTDISSVPTSIDFRNETPQTIYVVLDNNRESYLVGPGGQVTFGQAHVGDSPTIYVSDCDGCAIRYSRNIGPRTNFHSSYGWDGSRF